MENINASDLREALSQFATGVTIVTSVGTGMEPIGVTANSFNSVSLDPPMVLWSLSDSARSRNAFQAAEYFCVHVLTADQQELCERFACQGADKFAGLAWSRGPGDVPLLAEYVARFLCRNVNQYAIGDHIVFIGEVLSCKKSEKRPLVYHGGQYALAERRLMADVALRFERRKSRADNRRSSTCIAKVTDTEVMLTKKGNGPG